MQANVRISSDRTNAEFLVFLHVPKTAGTTVLECIRSNFEPTQVLMYYPPENITPPESVPDPRAMAGHLAYGHAEKLGFTNPRYFTFVRDPLKRAVSQVNFAKRNYPENVPDVETQGVEGAIVQRRLWFFDNVMVRLFAGIRNDVPFGELTEAHLHMAIQHAQSGFMFIGEQEHFNQDLTLRLRKVGWFNPTPTLRHNVGDYKDLALTESDLVFLREHNRFDHELYRFMVAEITCHNDRNIAMPTRPIARRWLSNARSSARTALPGLRRFKRNFHLRWKSNRSMTMVDLAVFGVTHRCGSTLLQRVFNANPDTMVWGENGRALRLFARIYKATHHYSEVTAQLRDDYFESNRTLQAQNLANLCPSTEYVDRAIVEAIRGYFETLYAGHRKRFKRLGFKEVRHGEPEISLFRRAYPDAEIVLLARNPIDTWHSLPISWGGYENVQEFIEVYTTHLAYYKRLSAEEPRVQFFWYEMILTDEQTQRRLMDVAGVTEEQFRAVVQVKVGSTREQEHKPDADVELIRELCGVYLDEIEEYM